MHECTNKQLCGRANPRGDHPGRHIMQTIGLAAAKGGVGKTTLTSWLAAAALLEDPDRRIAVMDLDPQGSLTLWWNRRGGAQPSLVRLKGESIATVQARLALARFDLLIVDCPPGFSDILQRAISASDLILIPTGASGLDLEAVASTAAMAERAGVPFRYVLNRVQFRSRLTGQAVNAIRERGRLLPVVHLRAAAAEAIGRGLTAMETQPQSPAACEQAELWQAVRAALAEVPRRRQSGLAGRSPLLIGRLS